MTPRIQTRALGGLALAAIALTLPASAAAQGGPFAPWDGRNPFNCKLQDLGTGVDYQDPDADPLCVRFDKTNQNVTDFGLVEFLGREPARVAAAVPKCFYFQRDEWQGWIVQGSDPELWHWDGRYFFDKARSVGGVNVTNFRLAGMPMDFTAFVPPAYRPYFDEDGGGGVMTTLEGPSDPACAARVDTPEESERVYRDEPSYHDCISPGGELRGRRVGRVALGMRRKRIRARLGEPRWTRKRTDHWCVIGAANLRVSYRTGRAALVRSTSRGHAERGVGPGTRRDKAKRRLDLRYRFRVRHSKVFEAKRRDGRRLFAGLRKGRVRWLALADPDRIRDRASVKRALRARA